MEVLLIMVILVLQVLNILPAQLRQLCVVSTVGVTEVVGLSVLVHLIRYSIIVLMLNHLIVPMLRVIERVEIKDFEMGDTEL